MYCTRLRCGASAEIAPAPDAVQIGHCAVLDHRTKSGGLGVNSPEGPLFNFIPEMCEESDHSERGNTVGLGPESVCMTCECI